MSFSSSSSKDIDTAEEEELGVDSMKSRDDYEFKMEEALYDWASLATIVQNTENGGADNADPKLQRQKQRRVLFSFAMAAALLKDRPVLELEGLIRKTSTHERLKYILDCVENKNSAWSNAVRSALNAYPNLIPL